MENRKRRLLKVWESRKHLIVLLLTVGVFAVLAFVAPRVSAGPNPVPPEQTIPVGGATLPYAWFGSLAPLVALVALALGAAGIAVFWRNRQR